MQMYTWDFMSLRGYIDLWGQGVFVTLLLSAEIIITGTVLGAVMVMGIKAKYRIIRILFRFLIDFLRAIPALVLLGTLYFVLPILSGLTLNALTIAFIALSINLAPFASECIRGGIDSIPQVQYESAKIIGFKGWKLFYYIIAPQALRRILPALSGQWVTSLKLTSLAATIGVGEIWHVTGQVITDTALPLEARIVGACLYVAIILPSLWCVLWLERSFNVKGYGQIVNQ